MAKESKTLWVVEFISMFDRDTRRVSIGRFHSRPGDFEKDFKANYLNAEYIRHYEEQKGNDYIDKPKSKKAVKRKGNNDTNELFARDDF